MMTAWRVTLQRTAGWGLEPSIHPVPGRQACLAVIDAEWCSAHKAGRKEPWHSAAKGGISLLLTGNSCEIIDHTSQGSC